MAVIAASLSPLKLGFDKLPYAAYSFTTGSSSDVCVAYNTSPPAVFVSLAMAFTGGAQTGRVNGFCEMVGVWCGVVCAKDLFELIPKI